MHKSIIPPIHSDGVGSTYFFIYKGNWCPKATRFKMCLCSCCKNNIFLPDQLGFFCTIRAEKKIPNKEWQITRTFQLFNVINLSITLDRFPRKFLFFIFLREPNQFTLSTRSSLFEASVVIIFHTMFTHLAKHISLIWIHLDIFFCRCKQNNVTLQH